MRAALVGFFIGVVVAAAGLYIARPRLVAPIAEQVTYRFETCVFGTPEFPNGDIENGRLLRRTLMPVSVSTRFFNSQFEEVKEATTPGRYGAVVRLDFGGGVHTDRFVTLYRTPARVRGDVVTIPISAPFPAEFGLDPTVVRMQHDVIGSSVQNMLIGYETSRSPEQVAILLAGLHEMKPSDPPAFLHDGPQTRNEAWWYELQTRLGCAPEYHYLVDLPRNYDADPAKRWPLILFLHHADASGSDLNDVRTCALAGLIHRGKDVPAIVVSPQRPAAQEWNMPALFHLIDTMAARYRVDPDRVYLTGVSAGGDLTWDLALIHPERFAAIVPMSGESDPRDAARLRDLPVWVFQGGKDPIVPPVMASEMADAVRQAGGHAHLTVYPDSGHDCWDQAYSTDALWTWLFAQKRGQPEIGTPGMPSP